MQARIFKFGKQMENESLYRGMRLRLITLVLLLLSMILSSRNLHVNIENLSPFFKELLKLES